MGWGGVGCCKVRRDEAGWGEEKEEEEEEEEERLPRSHGRWALASSPGAPTQTSRGSPERGGEVVGGEVRWGEGRGGEGRWGEVR